MSFEKDKYEVVKRAVPKDVASFCYAYFLNKRQVAKQLTHFHPIPDNVTTMLLLAP